MSHPLLLCCGSPLEPFCLWEGSDGDSGAVVGDLGNGAGEQPVGEFALWPGSPQADRDTAAGPRRTIPLLTLRVCSGTGFDGPMSVCIYLFMSAYT